MVFDNYNLKLHNNNNDNNKIVGEVHFRAADIIRG